MWKDTLMSIINDIINWIDTVIFRNKPETSTRQVENAPVVPIYGKKAKKNNVKSEAKSKRPHGRAKKETPPNGGSTKKPRTKKPTRIRKSSKSIKK